VKDVDDRHDMEEDHMGIDLLIFFANDFRDVKTYSISGRDL